MTSSSITFIEKAKHGYREKALRPSSFPGQGSAVFSPLSPCPTPFNPKGFRGLHSGYSEEESGQELVRLVHTMDRGRVAFSMGRRRTENRPLKRCEVSHFEHAVSRHTVYYNTIDVYQTTLYFIIKPHYTSFPPKQQLCDIM